MIDHTDHAPKNAITTVDAAVAHTGRRWLIAESALINYINNLVEPGAAGGDEVSVADVSEENLGAAINDAATDPDRHDRRRRIGQRRRAWRRRVPRSPCPPGNRDATMTGKLLACEAVAIRELDANVVSATDIGTHAVEYAIRNWPVFPLNRKVPAISGRKGGKGVLDATTDLNTVVGWWSGRYAGCNIGLRVPATMVVIDLDPRNGGLESLAAVEVQHGPLPATLTTWSGRGDGGRHLYFRRPRGQLTAMRLGDGIDVKTSTGYVVAAPSIHPDTGNPYIRSDVPVATPPAWLVNLLVNRPVDRRTVKPPRRWHTPHHGPSIADAYSDNTSWAEILGPHGWRCIDVDPDADGARWLHPTANSLCSATIRNNCLFVYSTNTPFEITEPGTANGYTKFRTYAVLNHGGDLSAAAKALSNQKIAT